MPQRDDMAERARPHDVDHDAKLEWGLLSPHTTKSANFRSVSSGSSGSPLRRLPMALFRIRLGLQLLTVAACLSWMTASSWAILVNKHIMVSLKFPYPCTIAWMGLLTTTLASYAAVRLRSAVLRRAAAAAFAASGGGGGGGAATATATGGGGGGGGGALVGLYPSASALSSSALSSSAAATSWSFSRAVFGGIGGGGGGGGPMTMTPVSPRYYLTRVLPTGFFMALTFQTGNMGYLYLTVAFVQMLKAFCPVVTMLLLFVARLEAPSRRLVAAVTLIAVGVALASYGELNLSLVGLSAMLVSVVAESVRLVMTQYLLAAGAATSLSPLEGLFYISSACTTVLAVQASYLEWPQLLRQRHYLAVPGHPYIFAAAACCGFLVNLLAILVIKLASSLTLKVLGTVKDAALVSIGILFLHERVTSLQLVGYTISMIGFLSYNMIKAAQQHLHRPGDGGMMLGGLGGGGGGSGVVISIGSFGGGRSNTAARSLLPYYGPSAGTASSKAR